MWPTDLVGGGTIAIVELGGGWVKSDVDAYFAALGQPSPTITDVSVDVGAVNTPGTDADAEVALDIQVAGAAYYAATGKTAIIRVYWAANDAGGIGRAIDLASYDGCDVCSISWGADEAVWGGTYLHRLGNSALNASRKGMAIFAASGDNNSADGGPGAANVDAPASCPRVVGCGGTHKDPENAWLAETVWNNNPGNANGEGTGGGFSTYFKLSSSTWQLLAPAGPGRMVPDVAANADPQTGYQIVLNGQPIVVGGTSAVAPLYAGLFASFGRKLGFVTPMLWKNQLAFTDIIQGDNGAFRARFGPDPCTGLGSPIGTKIAALFVKSRSRSRLAR
jgi:subtilase family serine protease